MFRAVLIAILVLGFSACANGWPYVRHAAANSAASTCTPTTSKIARSGCLTSMPANRATGEDLEREQRITGAPSSGKFPK
jgi:hypothetical protein